MCSKTAARFWIEEDSSQHREARISQRSDRTSIVLALQADESVIVLYASPSVRGFEVPTLQAKAKTATHKY